MQQTPTHTHRIIIPIVGMVCIFAITGCQLGPSVSTNRLLQSQAMVDPTGLKESSVCEAVKVHVSPPQKWEPAPLKKGTAYTHQRWNSPSQMTGLGAIYIRMPFPFPAKAVAWLAQREYAKKADDGKMLGQWEDSMGRPWFEAETSWYHARGYVVTKGFDAWIVYCGYNRAQPPSAAEIGVAWRAMETIVPTPFASDIPQKPMAAASHIPPGP